MTDFIAHPRTKEDLEAIISAPKACYMLVGPKWSGKRSSALYVAQGLGSDQFDRIHIIPNEKGSITIEMAHNLVDALAKKATRATATRIVIIESAESMTSAAQNALLKVIEEPPAQTIFLLLVTNGGGLLSTITSRCQTIYMRPVSDKQLKERGISDSIITISRGRVGLVAELANSPEQNDIQNDIISRGQEIIFASPLDRILLADKLASDKQLPEIIDWLAYTLSKSVRNQKATSQSLASMQNYFIYSNAGVSNKHALTEMMIRL